MDWNLAMEDNRGMLKRIVALLYAFAVLAERLCDRPRPVRSFVFWILRFAETVARDFVVDTALEQGAPMTPALLLALHGGDSAADAMRLAQSFRALAVLLDGLADSNPGCLGSTRISTLCLGLAACAADGRLLAATTFERRQLCLAPPRLAIRRCDSS